MNDLLTALNGKAFSFNATGLRGSSVALLAASAAETSNRAVLCVVPTERQAELFEQDLVFFTDIPVLYYPGYDIPPYTPLSPDPVTVATRLTVLYKLITQDKPFIVVASCEALLRLVIPRQKLAGLAELVMIGEESDQEELVSKLSDAGYESMALVQSVGDFSVRGGIIDVFPPGFQNPVRLDFFGDTVESIRSFDPVSQRSIEQLEEVVFLPASNILFPAPDSDESRELEERFMESPESEKWLREEKNQILDRIKRRYRFPGIEFFLPFFYPSASSLFEYFADDSLVFMVDPFEVKRTVSLTWERIDANYHEAIRTSTPALKPDALFLTKDRFEKSLSHFSNVNLYDFPDADLTDGDTFPITSGNHQLIKQELELQRKTRGLLAPLASIISNWLDHGDRVVLACRSARHTEHFAELLNQHGVQISFQQSPFRLDDLHGAESSSSVLLFDQPLSEGFDLINDKLHVLSEGELFGERRLGFKKKTSKKRRIDAGEPVRFDELKTGDVVVHNEHGLGIYEGLTKMELQGVANDFLQISYKGEDRLYVPVDRINVVNKYKGLSDKKPKADKLGGKSWVAAKNKVKEAVWAIAQDLLNLYAKRKLKKGHAFSPPSELYYELEETFPFDETPGQKKAINDVLTDLSEEKAMDRLICGDVGYGKTEVAVRAAFKVIEDGYQIAVLVPTTVLAEQHAKTFRDRLHGFPVRIESLNRFRSTSSQKKILQGLSDGKVDIIIGTHRLLSKDVSFKQLGLLIVDEEHRFGVSHKEKMKRIRAEVDVLTLTATPIPRTLQMSLLGVRDLSVITTPPEHRRKVLTFVARYDDLVIKEAVVRELQRKGQVFLVHNRVQSIHQMAERVQKLVPEAKISAAHGQMPGKSLEEIMVRFVNKEIDVLVCTTIIESGLDISNANTIIINRADRLGLAEIYQLRGRVGRSREQSYAYLLVPSLDGLSKDAKDRLRALMDCSDLGGGFKLAMSDLQIRGGGNILGVSQSGHIAAVGYDLYLDLLQKTVADLKRKAAQQDEGVEDIEPEINLQLSAYIPEQFILNTDQRYISYRRIAGVASLEELYDLKDELEDRYGPLPVEVVNLIEIISIKVALRRMRITKLEQGKDTVVFSFHEQPLVDPLNVLQILEKSKNRVRFTPDSRLVVNVPLEKNTNPQVLFNAIREVLSALEAEPAVH